MYGMANVDTMEIEAQEAMRKLMRMCDDLMRMCDAYTTSQQSKVIIEALTKLRDSKQLSDGEYSRALKRVLKDNGFDLYVS